MLCSSDEPAVTAKIPMTLLQRGQSYGHDAEDDDDEDEEIPKLLSQYLTSDGRQFLGRVGWAGNAQIDLVSLMGGS